MLLPVYALMLLLRATLRGRIPRRVLPGVYVHDAVVQGALPGSMSRSEGRPP